VADITKQSGGRRTKGKSRRLRGGATFFDSAKAATQQLLMRPIPSSAPPSFGQDLQTMARGQQLGASPEASQPAFTFQTGPFKA
jgi:hypothetical protein